MRMTQVTQAKSKICKAFVSEFTGLSAGYISEIEQMVRKIKAKTK